MPAGYQELYLEQGTTFFTSVALDDIDGVPYLLDGAEVKAQIRKSYYSTQVAAEFIVEIPNPDVGVIVLSLEASNTANIFPGRYVYDVCLKDAENAVTRLLEGIITISPQVTRF
jgi:hypothetical protein